LEQFMFDEILTMMEAAIAVMVGLIERGHPLSCGASGGKDSGCATILMLEAVRRVTAARGPALDHFIMSADTSVENPSLLSHLHLMLDEIKDWIADSELPVSVHVAMPSLANQFVVSTIGRGTLVRTPENGVRDSKRIRPCSWDWKVLPQNRLRAKLERETRASGSREIITILGNRVAESSVRKTAMLQREESPIEPVRSADGNLTLSPLFDWSVEDVWTMLAMFSNEKTRPFPSPISTRTVERMANLYRAGNEGTCGVVLGESGSRAACGSRF
jgi:DNA sulfur modification protein DndC